MEQHPRESIPGWGVDRERGTRPGVPMEMEPHPTADWGLPERQEEGEEALEREGLRRVTPVFGTAQPAHGVSGWLRRRAYAVSDPFARRWMLLLLADRVDVLEHRARRALAALPFAAALATVGLLIARELRRD